MTDNKKLSINFYFLTLDNFLLSFINFYSINICIKIHENVIDNK